MVGETVGKYLLLEEIGRGAMGRVYKARDTTAGQVVALKLIADKFLRDREILARFQREGQATAALAHPNICAVYEAGDWHGMPFIAMEYLEGANLAHRMKAGHLDTAEILLIAIPVSSALAATHSIGVIHRDIKPANLFLTNAGQIKVLDFGLAKVGFRPAVLMGDDAPTMSMFATLPGTRLGTLAYMSPEQMRCEPVDARADLYSLGIVLHEALTGMLPMGGVPSSELPADIAPVVRRLIEMDREARFQTAAELHEVLQQVRRLKMQMRAAQ